MGFGLKLGFSAALTRTRIGTIVDTARWEREDEKTMLDVLLKEDGITGVDVDYGAIQNEWPSITSAACEVKLEDLMRPKKARKNKGEHLKC